MKQPLIPALVLTLTVFSANHASAANLLVDGGFESNSLDPWEIFGTGPTTIETSNPYSGTKHLQLSMSNANAIDNFSGLFQEIAVTAGQTYTFSGYGLATSSTGVNAFEYRFEWLDAGGTEIARQQNKINLDSSYNLFSLTDVAPTGAASAKIVAAIQSFDGDPDTIASLDNLSVNQIPEPSCAILLGLGLSAFILRRRS